MNYGFRDSKSNETAMHDFLGGGKNIQDAIQKKIKLTGIFLDLSKAHDMLNRNILLSKLQACEIRYSLSVV